MSRSFWSHLVLFDYFHFTITMKIRALCEVLRKLRGIQRDMALILMPFFLHHR